MAAAQPLASSTGIPESRYPDDSRPAVPPVRIAWRIALWWLVGFTSVFTTFGIVQIVAGRSQGGIAAGIFAIVFLLGVVAGLAALLRREIRAQRHMLSRFGPEGEARLSDSPVSARHVRKVAVICAVVALGLGLALALTPTTGATSTGTITVR